MPLLESCLVSLRRAVGGVGHEVIVIDNNSSDNSPTVAAAYFPEKPVLINVVNRGFAAACNQGAMVAMGEYLLFLNPDVEVDIDAIEQLLAVFAHGDRIGMAGGRIRHPDGTFQPTCRRFPTISNLFFSRGSFLSRLLREAHLWDRVSYTLPDYAQTTIVDAVAGTMVMIRRDLFTRAGGFDERFFLYMEDTDLSLWFNQHGYVNVFVSAAGATHHWRQGSRIGRLNRCRHHHHSMWKYFRKHSPGNWRLLGLLLLLTVNFLLVSIFPWPRRGV